MALNIHKRAFQDEPQGVAAWNSPIIDGEQHQADLRGQFLRQRPVHTQRLQRAFDGTVPEVVRDVVHRKGERIPLCSAPLLAGAGARPNTGPAFPQVPAGPQSLNTAFLNLSRSLRAYE